MVKPKQMRKDNPNMAAARREPSATTAPHPEVLRVGGLSFAAHQPDVLHARRHAEDPAHHLPGPGDGKTTTAINLATVMAQNGSRVLLIDADLRKPRLHRDFGKPQSPGLTNRIAGNSSEGNEAASIVTTDVEGLFLMPSGNQAPNPAELLSSDRMTRIIAMNARAFDHVIIDTAPILGLADSMVLSRLVDGVIVVTSAGKTPKESIKTSMRRLTQVRAPLIGVVLNAVDLESPDYAYYSSYYYNYESDDDSADDSEAGEKAGRRKALGAGS